MIQNQKCQASEADNCQWRRLINPNLAARWQVQALSDVDRHISSWFISLITSKLVILFQRFHYDLIDLAQYLLWSYFDYFMMKLSEGVESFSALHSLQNLRSQRIGILILSSNHFWTEYEAQPTNWDQIIWQPCWIYWAPLDFASFRPTSTTTFWSPFRPKDFVWQMTPTLRKRKICILKDRINCLDSLQDASLC